MRAPTRPRRRCPGPMVLESTADSRPHLPLLRRAPCRLTAPPSPGPAESPRASISSASRPFATCFKMSTSMDPPPPPQARLLMGFGCIPPSCRFSRQPSQLALALPARHPLPSALLGLLAGLAPLARVGAKARRICVIAAIIRRAVLAAHPHAVHREGQEARLAIRPTAAQVMLEPRALAALLAVQAPPVARATGIPPRHMWAQTEALVQRDRRAPVLLHRHASPSMD